MRPKQLKEDDLHYLKKFKLKLKEAVESNGLDWNPFINIPTSALGQFLFQLRSIDLDIDEAFDNLGKLEKIKKGRLLNFCAMTKPPYCQTVVIELKKYIDIQKETEKANYELKFLRFEREFTTRKYLDKADSLEEIMSWYEFKGMLANFNKEDLHSLKERINVWLNN